MNPFPSMNRLAPLLLLATVAGTLPARAGQYETLDYHVQQMIVLSAANDETGVQTFREQLDNLRRPEAGDAVQAQPLRQQGLEYLNHDQLKEALAAFRQAFIADPADPEIAGQLGLTYLRLRRLKEAERLLVYALALAPAQRPTPAHPGGDAAVVAAQLEDLLDGRAVLADEVAGAAVDGGGVGRLGHLDAQAAHRVGVGGAGDAAADALELAPCAPPGRRTRSATRAIVPTAAYSPSWRGTSRTCSSSPTSIGRVTSIVGKTTVSSRGIRSRFRVSGTGLRGATWKLLAQL